MAVKMIEMTLAWSELFMMSLFVFERIYLIPSKIEPSPFSMIKNKSYCRSVICIVV